MNETAIVRDLDRLIAERDRAKTLLEDAWAMLESCAAEAELRDLPCVPIHNLAARISSFLDGVS